MCSFRPELIAAKTAERLKQLEERKARLERLWDQLHGKDQREKGSRKKGEEEGPAYLIAQLKELARDLIKEAAFRDSATLAERAHQLLLEERGQEAAKSMEAADCLAIIALTLKETAQYDRALAIYEEIVGIASNARVKEKMAEYLTLKVGQEFKKHNYLEKANYCV